MIKIGLQNKTKPCIGKIEKYYFENKNIGLEKTLFHRIIIPLTPFDSGLDYSEQPETTKFVFEWFSLSLKNPNVLNNINMNHENYPDAEATIYIGLAHNWCNINDLHITYLENSKYKIKCNVNIEFEREDIAENENYFFETEVLLSEEIINET